MSDPLKHECGLAFIRLRKPLEAYPYPLYGLDKLYLLLEKQHNRGRDGIGIGSCKLNMKSGEPYIFRERNVKKNALDDVYETIYKQSRKLLREKPSGVSEAEHLKQHFEFAGEVLMGHLRYGTSGTFEKGSCHPYLRRSNWPGRTLMVQGNFNMTNSFRLNQYMMERGQHPVIGTDTQTVLEEIGYYLDHQHHSFQEYGQQNSLTGEDMAKHLSDSLDVVNALTKSSKNWDGGYAISGIIGTGHSFFMRDPHGIRPLYYFVNEDFIAAASERAPLMTVFNVKFDEVKELEPGHVVVIKPDGTWKKTLFTEPRFPSRPCSFERIYFSRGNDAGVYADRKALGKALVPQIMELISSDFANSVVSFIPNTAETAYYGLMDGLRIVRRQEVEDALAQEFEAGTLTLERIKNLSHLNWPRTEKIAIKDVQARTFISQEGQRNEMASHKYDVTYGMIKETDTLIVLDDSIVRGTTLRKSILSMLTRLNPKRIILVSTAPQIRYPDCYGIDMSELVKFIAFRAAIDLLQESGRSERIRETYELCKAELAKPDPEMINAVKHIYEPFTDEVISGKISDLVSPSGWSERIQIIYQTIENLHTALGENCGDWYFTGDYPTPGGYRVVNQSFVDYYENRSGRSY